MGLLHKFKGKFRKKDQRKQNFAWEALIHSYLISLQLEHRVHPGLVVKEWQYDEDNSWKEVLMFCCSLTAKWGQHFWTSVCGYVIQGWYGVAQEHRDRAFVITLTYCIFLQWVILMWWIKSLKQGSNLLPRWWWQSPLQVLTPRSPWISFSLWIHIKSWSVPTMTTLVYAWSISVY